MCVFFAVVLRARQNFRTNGALASSRDGGAHGRADGLGGHLGGQAGGEDTGGGHCDGGEGRCGGEFEDWLLSKVDDGETEEERREGERKLELGEKREKGVSSHTSERTGVWTVGGQKVVAPGNQ